MGKGKKGLGRDGEIEERESAKQFSARDRRAREEGMER